MSTTRTSLPPPRRWYAALIGTYLSGLASLVLALRRRKVMPTVESRDLLLLAAATNKLARLATQEKVTEPLRSPFTERVEDADGVTSERPHSRGGRRAVGELVTCPYCLSVWITTALTGALVLAPRPTRVVSPPSRPWRATTSSSAAGPAWNPPDPGPSYTTFVEDRRTY